MSKSSKDTTSADEREGLLNEYRMMKAEIHNAQSQRMQIISLTVGALGVVLSISANAALGSANSTPGTQMSLTVGGAIVMYAILIPSLIMMLSVQQAIQRMGSYIRIYIEPRVPGLNWENRWRDFMSKQKYKGGLRGLGGIYFFLSFLPLLLPLYSISQVSQNWAFILVLIPFAIWSLYLAYDLQAAVSRGWKWARWEEDK